MRVKWSDTGDGGLGTKIHETCHDDQSLENEETGSWPDSWPTSIIPTDRDRVISLFLPLVTDMMILSKAHYFYATLFLNPESKWQTSWISIILSNKNRKILDCSYLVSNFFLCKVPLKGLPLPTFLSYQELALQCLFSLRNSGERVSRYTIQASSIKLSAVKVQGQLCNLVHQFLKNWVGGILGISILRAASFIDFTCSQKCGRVGKYPGFWQMSNFFLRLQVSLIMEPSVYPLQMIVWKGRRQ